MAKKDKVLYKNRVWLNKDETARAYAIANVTADDFGVHAFWQIADCSRHVELDLGIWVQEWNMKKTTINEVRKDYLSRKDKIAKLREQIESIDTALDSWFEKFEEETFPKLLEKAEKEKKEFKAQTEAIKAINITKE